MKFLSSFLLFWIAVFFITNSVEASTYKNENRDNYTKVELEYQKGNYAAALEASDKYVKEVENLVGKNHFIYARLVFQNAKVNEALGDYAAYKKHIAEAKKSIAGSDKKDHKSYAEALIAGADCFMEYGDFGSARELLLKSGLLTNKILESKDPVVLDRLKLKYAEVLLQEGFTKQAFDLAQKSFEFRNERDVKKDMVANDKTGYKSVVKLSSEERKNRKRDIAESINLLIRIHIANGLYNQADSIIEETESWIAANLGKKDLLYVKNAMLDGVLLDIMNEQDLSAQMYTQAMDGLKKIKVLKSKMPSRLKLELYERLISSVREDNEDKSDNIRRDMYLEVFKSYGDYNMYMAKVHLSEVTELYMNESYVSADTMLRHLISNKKYFPVENLAKARALDLLYDIQLRLERFKEAERILTHIVDIKKHMYSHDSPVLQLNLLDLANFKVEYSNQFKEVDTVFVNGLKIIEKEVPHSYPEFFDYHYKYAQYLYFSDRLNEAEKLLKGACEKVKLEYGESSKEYAHALHHLAGAQTDNGGLTNAFKNLTLASSVLASDKTVEESDRIALFQEYIHYYTVIGDFEEVERESRKAKRIVRRNKKLNLAYAATVEQDIQLQTYQGQYSSAKGDVVELLVRYEKALGKDNKRLHHALCLASQLAFVTGDYNEAEDYALRSVDMTKAVFGERSLVHMQSLTMLQKIYLATGEFDLALELSENIVKSYRQKLGDRHYLLAQGLINLAHVRLLQSKNSEQAEQNFNEALRIIEQTLGKDHPEYAEALVYYAQLKIDQKDFAKAEEFLLQSRKIFEDKYGTGNSNVIDNDYMLGNLYVYRKQYDMARKQFAKSKNEVAKVFGKEHPSYVRSLSKEIQMEYVQGDAKKAIRDFDEVATLHLSFMQKYFDGLSEKEKNRNSVRIRNDFEFFNTMALQNSTDDPSLLGKSYNFALATKAMLLSSSIKTRQNIHSSKDTVLIRKYESWIYKNEILSSSLTLSAAQRIKDSINVEKLQKEIHNLENELRAKSEAFAKASEGQKFVTWQQVRDSLGHKDIALEMIRFRYFAGTFTDSIIYMALVVQPDSKNNPEVVFMNRGKEMEKRSFSFYKNCVRFDVKDDQSRAIYWQPLKQKVGTGKRIYFSPDGVYNLVNLEGIAADDGTKHVLDEDAIILVSNTKDIFQRPKFTKSAIVSGKGKVELFGNPAYYEDDESVEEKKVRHTVIALPGAEQEVKDIGAMLSSKGLKSEVFVNEDATEEKLKSLHDPKIFHIATHGFFLQDQNIEDRKLVLDETQHVQNPLLRSGLILSNGGKLIDSRNVYRFNSEEGVLTAFEAMNLYFDNTELVVLSACESAAGEVSAGEGVYGLQRAFLVAGAKSIIISLFKVSDEVTEELMSIFYKKWLETGDKRAAFIYAKKEIRAKYQSTKYWASFIMMGAN